jgi:hypothetical protein
MRGWVEAMFTTTAPNCTTGAVSAVLVSAATASAVATGTTVPGTWYRPIDGFGFPMDHKHTPRRPPSPTS